MKKIIGIVGLGLFILLTGCKKQGCTDDTATNFDSKAKKDDGSCLEPDPVSDILDCSIASNNSKVSSYDDITFCYIENNSNLLSTDNIIAISDMRGAKDSLLRVNDVIIYETTGDRYGKLKIVAIDSIAPNNNYLYIDFVTFKSNGEIYSEFTNIEVKQSFAADLDDNFTKWPSLRDFSWDWDLNDNLIINPNEGGRDDTAKFAVVDF